MLGLCRTASIHEAGATIVETGTDDEASTLGTGVSRARSGMVPETARRVPVGEAQAVPSKFDTGPRRGAAGGKPSRGEAGGEPCDEDMVVLK